MPYAVKNNSNHIIFFFFQGQGTIALPVEARQGVVPSMYTGHPSYAYPQGRDYAADRGYPGNPSTEGSYIGPFPTGAPPTGQHQGGPASTGFPNLGY